MIGAGGREYEDTHVKQTINVVNEMPLGPGDIIYFSKLKIREGSEYMKISREMGLTELNDWEMDMQIERIKAGLIHNPRPIYAIYDIDETIY